MRPLSTLRSHDHTILGLTLKLPFSGPKNIPGKAVLRRVRILVRARQTPKPWRGGFAIPRFLISASASISAWRSVEAVLFLRHYCTFQCRPRTYPKADTPRRPRVACMQIWSKRCLRQTKKPFLPWFWRGCQQRMVFPHAMH
jgi:hypothetical protein